jgi:hypothetical protein
MWGTPAKKREEGNEKAGSGVGVAMLSRWTGHTR